MKRVMSLNQQLRAIIWIVVILSIGSPNISAFGQKADSKPIQNPSRSKRTTPVKMVIPGGVPSDELIKALNEGLGQPFDYFNTSPLKHNFADLEGLKIGTLILTIPSVAKVLDGTMDIPASIKIINYNFEHWDNTPKEEQADVVSSAKSLRAFCNEHGYKMSFGPMYKDGLKLAKDLAPYFDMYSVQCQKFQREDRREETVRYLKEISETIHRINPNCMVGCQLGVKDSYGDGTAGDGLKNAIALYEETKDFIQYYGIFWPPDVKYAIDLLKAMDVSPAIK